MTWDECTLDMFLNISETEKIEDEAERIATLVSICSGIDKDKLLDMPYSEFSKITSDSIGFLSTKHPTGIVQEYYTINGERYFMNMSVENMPTGQFIDYSEQLKKDSTDFKALLAILLIPDGKKYAEGYKTSEIKEKVGNMLFIDVWSICFFFTQVLIAYTKASLLSSKRKLMKAKKRSISPFQKKKIDEAIVILDQQINGLG